MGEKVRLRRGTRGEGTNERMEGGLEESGSRDGAGLWGSCDASGRSDAVRKSRTYASLLEQHARLVVWKWSGRLLHTLCSNNVLNARDCCRLSRAREVGSLEAAVGRWMGACAWSMEGQCCVEELSIDGVGAPIVRQLVHGLDVSIF